MRAYLVAVVTLGALGRAAPAHADDPATPDLAPWAVAGFDVGVAGIMSYAALSGDLDDGKPAGIGSILVYSLTPIATMVGGAFGADALEAQARGGNLVHGATWGAALGLSLGAAIESRDATTIKTGTTTAALTVTGALLGGALGGLAVPGDRTEAAWFYGPMVGGIASVLVSGLVALFGQGDNPGRTMAIGGAIGISGGLALGLGLANLGDAPGPTARHRSAPLALTWQTAY